MADETIRIILEDQGNSSPPNPNVYKTYGEIDPYFQRNPRQLPGNMRVSGAGAGLDPEQRNQFTNFNAERNDNRKAIHDDVVASRRLARDTMSRLGKEESDHTKAVHNDIVSSRKLAHAELRRIGKEIHADVAASRKLMHTTSKTITKAEKEKADQEKTARKEHDKKRAYWEKNLSNMFGLSSLASSAGRGRGFGGTLVRGVAAQFAGKAVGKMADKLAGGGAFSAAGKAAFAGGIAAAVLGGLYTVAKGQHDRNMEWLGAAGAFGIGQGGPRRISQQVHGAQIQGEMLDIRSAEIRDQKAGASTAKATQGSSRLGFAWDRTFDNFQPGHMGAWFTNNLADLVDALNGNSGESRRQLEKALEDFNKQLMPDGFPLPDDIIEFDHGKGRHTAGGVF